MHTKLRPPLPRTGTKSVWSSGEEPETSNEGNLVAEDASQNQSAEGSGYLRDPTDTCGDSLEPMTPQIAGVMAAGGG
jgi:hypothetical protein